MKRFAINQKTLFAILLVLAAPVFARAEVRFARIFSDHAVLQRQKNIPVWGFAAAGETVAVAFGGETRAATADSSGRWSVVFAPREAGGPFELKASAASGEALVKDVLVGEVWLCSGQSNMEWTVKQADNFAAERKDADYPQIRHFFVEHRVEPDPQNDLRNGEWKMADASTVGDFSAIGFFFAREVYRKLNIPVGLVHSSWGGSQIEGWISRDGMLSSNDLRDYAQNLPKDWPAADAFLERHVKKATLGDENRNPTLDDEKKYTENGYDFSKWLRGGPVGQWDWQGIWAWRGNGFMARKVDVPAGFVGRETVLGLAESYSYNEIYVNGTRVFAGVTKGKRAIIVPRNTWRPGDNSLVVKMNRAIEPEWYGLGFAGSPDDVYLAAGDERIPLASESWYLMPAFAEKHEFAHSSNNVGTFIYNGMIAPLVPYAMRGVLWYQGETNAGRAYQYRRTFPLLIDDWRKKWGDDFYFYFVQLSSYGANRSANDGSNWAELREAQTMTLQIPKTAMAVTTDVGNPDNIHPTNKQTVGRRLAAAAFDNIYGLKMPFSGPLYDAVRFENGRAVVTFKYTDGGLTAKDKFGYVRGFEIAGADRKFFYARAEIAGNTVVVSNPEVRNPVAVRYAWADAPVDANLYNGAGFPASSFRTDDWPPVTLNGRFW